MSQAWNLFVRSFVITARNFGALLKIWLSTIVLLLFLMSLFDWFVVNPIIKSGQAASAIVWLFGFVLFFFACWSFSGIWSNSLRYLLEDDFHPSWLPFHFDVSRSWNVFTRLVSIALIIVFICWVAIQIDRMFLKNTALNKNTLIALVILTYIILCVAFWVALRLTMSAIGSAVNAPMSLIRAWKITRPQWLVFACLVALLSLLNLLVRSLGNAFSLWFAADILGFESLGTIIIGALGLMLGLFMNFYFIVLLAEVYKKYAYGAPAT